MFENLKLQWPLTQGGGAVMQTRTIDEITALIDEGYWHGAGTTAAARRVTHETALRQATVWACVRIISEIIAQLPIGIQVKEAGRWKAAETHELLELLAYPNDWQTQHDLISTLIMWAESQGNGYLFKVGSKSRVHRLLPVQSSKVSITVSPDWGLTYSLAEDKEGVAGTFGADKIFHLRNFGSKGYCGLSTIGNHREGIALAIQLEQHAANSYENGLQSTKYIHSEKTLGDKAREALENAVKKLSGSLKAGKVPIFSGVKIEDMGALNMTDAQYIESRRLQQQQIASIFGVPMFLLNDTEKATTWGTGLEQFTKSFVRFSLSPRMNRLGQTIIKELVPRERRQSTRVVFDTDTFTLGEFKERMEGYQKGIDSGVINPNEAREREGMNPREQGDEYRMPRNIGRESDPAPGAVSKPNPPASEPPADPE